MIPSELCHSGNKIKQSKTVYNESLKKKKRFTNSCNVDNKYC